MNSPIELKDNSNASAGNWGLDSVNKNPLGCPYLSRYGGGSICMGVSKLCSWYSTWRSASDHWYHRAWWCLCPGTITIRCLVVFFSRAERNRRTCEASELTVNSIGLFVKSCPYGFPLVVLHTNSISTCHLWCILGGSV